MKEGRATNKFAFSISRSVISSIERGGRLRLRLLAISIPLPSMSLLIFGIKPLS